MAPSPALRLSSAQAWLSAVLLLGVCVVAGISIHYGMVRADNQPTLTITLNAQGSSGTLVSYKSVATGFAAGASITETIGDGTGIPPAVGHANSVGNMTVWWTLDASNKYCGTLTAKSDTASAGVSFWVAVASDQQSGTTCAPPTSSGGGTPTAASTTSTTATAIASASVTAAATHAPAPQPTIANSDTGGNTGGSIVPRILGQIPWMLVLLGGGGFLVVLTILMAVMRASRSNRRKAAAWRAAARRGTGHGPRVADWAAMPTRRGPAQGRVGGGANGYGGAGWSAQSPNEPPRYVPGGSVQRSAEPEYGPSSSIPGRSGRHLVPRVPQPDVRWSGSHPSAARPRAGAPGRTLRDAPAPGRRPGAPDSSFLQDQ